MKITNGDWEGSLVQLKGGSTGRILNGVVHIQGGTTTFQEGDTLVLEDPATLGCLKSFVREALQAPFAEVSPCVFAQDGDWTADQWIFRPHKRGACTNSGTSESDAWVQAVVQKVPSIKSVLP